MMLNIWFRVLLQGHVDRKYKGEHSRFDLSTHCIDLPVSQPAASCAPMRVLSLLLLLCTGKGLTPWRLLQECA